jgi:hypothetical protein
VLANQVYLTGLDYPAGPFDREAEIQVGSGAVEMVRDSGRKC